MFSINRRALRPYDSRTKLLVGRVTFVHPVMFLGQGRSLNIQGVSSKLITYSVTSLSSISLVFLGLKSNQGISPCDARARPLFCCDQKSSQNGGVCTAVCGRSRHFVVTFVTNSGKQQRPSHGLLCTSIFITDWAQAVEHSIEVVMLVL